MADPLVSTGATESNVPDGFFKDRFNVSVKRRGETLSFEVGPEFILGHGRRIEGLRREIGAKYCVLRDGNRCTIGSSFCIMGGHPFANPIHADFDHIDGDRSNHRTENVRLACHPCNSHQQKLQGKSGPSPPSSEIEKERQSGGPLSPTDKRILDLSRGYEVAGRSFIFRLLLDAHKQGKTVDPDEVRVKVRNETGCSRATSYSIMERLVVGEDSCLLTKRDQITGESGLRFRNSNCYNMTLAQINAEYPARGYLSKRGFSLE